MYENDEKTNLFQQTGIAPTSCGLNTSICEGLLNKKNRKMK